VNAEGGLVRASDVLIAVEIISPGSFPIQLDLDQIR
jgi:hypothetical protein